MSWCRPNSDDAVAAHARLSVVLPVAFYSPLRVSAPVDDDEPERDATALARQPEHDPALSAALGWPGGISDPVLDRKTLLQQVAALAQEQAGCKTEADCTSQPWCKVRGECQRKQEQAEPAQEPVAKVELMTAGGNAGLATRIVEIDDHLRERLRPGQLLYTAPPQRKSLTDEEIMALWQRHIRPVSFARAIERKVRGETE